MSVQSVATGSEASSKMSARTRDRVDVREVGAPPFGFVRERVPPHEASVGA